MTNYAIAGGGRVVRRFSEYSRLLEIPHTCSNDMLPFKKNEDSGVDAVAHNDMQDINRKVHSFSLHTPMQIPVPCMDAEALVRTINNLMEAV
jgi:hypothetical protein